MQDREVHDLETRARERGLVAREPRSEGGAHVDGGRRFREASAATRRLRTPRSPSRRSTRRRPCPDRLNPAARSSCSIASRRKTPRAARVASVRSSRWNDTSSSPPEVSIRSPPPSVWLTNQRCQFATEAAIVPSVSSARSAPSAGRTYTAWICGPLTSSGRSAVARGSASGAAATGDTARRRTMIEPAPAARAVTPTRSSPAASRRCRRRRG